MSKLDWSRDVTFKARLPRSIGCNVDSPQQQLTHTRLGCSTAGLCSGATLPLGLQHQPTLPTLGDDGGNAEVSDEMGSRYAVVTGAVECGGIGWNCEMRDATLCCQMTVDYVHGSISVLVTCNRARHYET